MSKEYFEICHSSHCDLGRPICHGQGFNLISDIGGSVKSHALAKTSTVWYLCVEADRPWKCTLRPLGGARKRKLEFAKW